MMAINDRIKEARLNNKLTQEQLANLIGVAKTTITGYEKGTSEPSIDTMAKIMDVLHIDANYLWQDETNFPIVASYQEMQIINKYRTLDNHGRRIVNYVLDEEYERISLIQKKAKDYTINNTKEPMVIYPYVLGGASAGLTSFLTDIELDKIKAPVCDDADFVISVSGDSMEPTYYDGEKVYVKKTFELNIGDIGIFSRGNELFIKEYGEDGLISHNSKYKMIKGTENIQTIGKVVGKIED